MAAATAIAAAGQLRVSSKFPRLFALPIFSSYSSKFSSIHSRQVTLPLFPALSFALPAISLSLPSLPSLLDGIWEGILRAVPKKKTSHSKVRKRQMTGKALKDVTSLCKCPACGNIKKTHYLCTHCMEKLQKAMLKKRRAESKEGPEGPAA